MSTSPWSAYGRLPSQRKSALQAGEDVTLGAIENLERGREQVQQYMERAMREYFEIRAGDRGYRSIIEAALNPSPSPESIEERLKRLAGEAVARRKTPKPGQAR